MGHMLLPTDLTVGLKGIRAARWRRTLGGIGMGSVSVQNLGEVDIAIDLGFLTQSADDLPLRRDANACSGSPCRSFHKPNPNHKPNPKCPCVSITRLC